MQTKNTSPPTPRAAHVKASKAEVYREPTSGLGIYHSINKVQAELARIGIQKNNVNAHQKFKFRGIDDVYNAIAPLLHKYNLCILPTVIEREVTERTVKAGYALFYSCVTVRYDLVCSLDGTSHSITVVGEAMDSGDKATNKAMSAAYKYACLQTFCIPTESESLDSDAETHDKIKPEAVPAPQLLSKQQLKSIRHLINISGSKEVSVCEHMKVKKLEDVTSAAFVYLHDKLNKKIRQQNVD